MSNLASIITAVPRLNYKCQLQDRRLWLYESFEGEVPFSADGSMAEALIMTELKNGHNAIIRAQVDALQATTYSPKMFEIQYRPSASGLLNTFGAKTAARFNATSGPAMNFGDGLRLKAQSNIRAFSEQALPPSAPDSSEVLTCDLSVRRSEMAY